MSDERRTARIKRRDALALLSAVMQQPVGREYLYDLLASLHVYSTSFSPNALQMAFGEGERNAGLRINADLVEAAPDLYLQMLKEAGNVRFKNTSGSYNGSGNADSEFDPLANAGITSDSESG